MGIERTPNPKTLEVVFEFDNKEYIEKMKKNPRNCVMEYEKRGNIKKTVLSLDEHEFVDSAFYYQSRSNTIEFNGTLRKIAPHGDYKVIGETRVNFSIPLSDTVLIDILQHSVKKFNKLKGALESLNK